MKKGESKIEGKNLRNYGIGKSICGMLLILIVTASATLAQIGNGTSTAVERDTSNKADLNLKSAARVNPSTLAMEFSLPLMTYTGRSGNSLPIGFSYSSKVWRMETQLTWWYPTNAGHTRYVSDVNAKYGGRTAAGWTSNLQPPRIENKGVQLYTPNGKPWNTELLDDAGLNVSWENILSSFDDNLLVPCGTVCIRLTNTAQFPDPPNIVCIDYITQWCVAGPQNPGEPGTGGPVFPEPPPPTNLSYIKRLQVSLPDGSTHEFRQDDAAHYCGDTDNPCIPNRNGTYLSVDGSAMKLVKESGGSILYMPNGGKYIFPGTGGESIYATEYVDVDGNKMKFETFTSNGETERKWTDTMGREIVDVIPHNWITQTQIRGTKEINLPGMGQNEQKYYITWENLKPLGCETDTSNSCTNDYEQVGGALEDQTQKLYYEARYFCEGNISQDLLTITNNPDSPLNEVLFPNGHAGVRPCNSFNILRDTNGNPVLDAQGLAQPLASRFNPVVMSKVQLPNGQSYQFKYNRYGEISKIIYPTGNYEEFDYGWVQPIEDMHGTAFNQTNRGVKEHRIFDVNHNLQQKIKYETAFTYASGGNSTYGITTTSSKAADPHQWGAHSVRTLHSGYGTTKYGFDRPLSGMVKEEKAYDELGQIRSRTINEWTHKGSGQYAKRDVRLSKSVTFAFEPGSTYALANLGKTFYENDDNLHPEFFSHLNVKRREEYDYTVIPAATAENTTPSWTTIDSWFPASKLVSVSETDYQYDLNYKARGIASLPIETRVLNPQNPSQIIAQTQTVYDEPSRLVADSGNLSGNPAATWSDPSTTLRGKPTTEKVWDSDNNTWIETHTQYDQYGNVRKVWEAATAATFDPTRFVETEYSSYYAFAYPTKVNAPAPGDGTYGTTQGSTASMTYDFNTGLPLTTTNDAGQTTATEYNDALLRPTRTYAINFTAPETQTIYNHAQRWIKIRKQIDANNWEEGTTFLDSFGRVVKSQSKDSQGDVFVETEYDFSGRVKRTSNPYRQGETIYWSKPRYDELGRSVESFAPAENGQTGASLGVMEYGISTAPGFIGATVTTTDAAGKKGRSFTNALGQLTRVDEPNYEGNLTPVPQGSPETNPSPTPTPDDPLDPPCSVQCLTGGAYPSYSTYYKYNVQGKLVEVVQGEQHRYFKYDSLGRLIRVRQPEQQINNSLDLPDSYNTSGEWTAKFTYDVMGNISTSTDANGTVITYIYDKARRVIKKSYSDGTSEVKYFYDGLGLDTAPPATNNFAKGKLTKVTSSVSETRYTKFDYLGRLTESEQRTPFGNTSPAPTDAKVSKYSYDFSGVLIEQEYPNGRKVKSEVEADGDLARVFGQANANAPVRTYANSFAFTASGNTSQMRLGNGRWETAKFNERTQITELSLGNSAGDTSLWKLGYEFRELDANGNVISSKNTGNLTKQTITFNGLSNPLVQTFKYDSLYRLIEAKEMQNSQQTWIQQFGYDRYGNRISFNQNIGTILQSNQTPAVDPLTNRFTSSDYTYDSNGNIVTDIAGGGSSRNFTFNGDNKQIEIKNGNSTIGRYFYDGEGKRVKKVTNLETTVFIYDGMGKLIAEYSTEISQTPQIKYLTEDHLKTPRIVTDGVGNVIARRDFLPFGEDMPVGIGARSASLKYGVTDDDIRQKFTGYQKDKETSLDLAEARMYENRFGRFTAVDPLLASGKSANPQTFNRYAYTSNNPVNRVDINGLDWYIAFRRLNGVWHIRPKWCGGFGCRGFRWGTTGSFKLDGQVRNWDTRSFAFQDDRIGGFGAFDFYENRSAHFNTLEDAESQVEAWNRQAAVNFLAGALEGASLAFELTGAADGLKAERNSQMFKMGVKAGTGASIAGAITGVGVVNALTKGFKGARAIFKGINIVCCFVEGTTIHTEKGLVPIEQIKIGDKVLSYDEKTKTYEYKPVAQTFTAVKENIVKIKIRGEKLLTTTTEHPFYVKKSYKARDNLSSNDDEEGEWLTAAELKVGQKVLRPDGTWTRITAIEQSTEPTIVYNLEVEGNHNYFVGEIGVLSHNCNSILVGKLGNSSEMITKGIHVHIGGLEISLRPGANGSIIFKPGNAAARDNAGLFNDAVKQLEGQLTGNEKLREKLIQVTTAARDTFTSGKNSSRVNGMGAEFNFLLNALRNIGN